ncbi:hypothetical protein CDAR_418531 [Caerostris darwini]|uniref:Peptidase M12B propeptide domain-containing protein n=1 Tax=Caerostris darwini TaxID=1538125 RepID=A0AAV4MV18_9ARAC|nr:hypothetical protein CDAR_418531 [Caerostris darwini]
MELPAAAITTMFVVCSVVYGSVNRSRRQAEFISQDVTNFDLVKPTKVTSEGQFLSYDVRHYTKRYHNGRARRSVEDDYVHYAVHIDGLQTLLKLRPNANLLSPGLVVERKGEMTRLARSKHHQEHCFFHGNVVDNGTYSHVALSTCDGLVDILPAASVMSIAYRRGRSKELGIGQGHFAALKAAERISVTSHNPLMCSASKLGVFPLNELDGKFSL